MQTRPMAASGPRPDAGTRARILGYVSEHGPITAGELARRVDLTAAAVRRHLESLTESGEIVPAATAVPRGRGRPPRAYVLAPAGHRRMGSAYDDIASEALRFLGRRLGSGAVVEFARERGEAVRHRYAPEVEAAGADPGCRVRALAAALTADGYAASARPVGMPGAVDGVQLCQGHCPLYRVAAEYPQFCEAETAAFATLLGVHVQRLATQAAGAHTCTTFIPLAAAQTAAAPDRDRRPAPAHEQPANERTLS